MPWGSWINELPTEFFLVVHIAAFAIGASFAWLAFKRELGRGKQGERGAEQRQLMLERQPGEAGSEREGGDVHDQEELGRQIVDPTSPGHVLLLVFRCRRSWCRRGDRPYVVPDGLTDPGAPAQTHQRTANVRTDARVTRTT